jgi:hypothetical protein
MFDRKKFFSTNKKSLLFKEILALAFVAFIIWFSFLGENNSWVRNVRAGALWTQDIEVNGYCVPTQVDTTFNTQIKNESKAAEFYYNPFELNLAVNSWNNNGTGDPLIKGATVTVSLPFETRGGCDDLWGMEVCSCEEPLYQECTVYEWGEFCEDWVWGPRCLEEREECNEECHEWGYCETVCETVCDLYRDYNFTAGVRFSGTRNYWDEPNLAISIGNLGCRYLNVCPNNDPNGLPGFPYFSNIEVTTGDVDLTNPSQPTLSWSTTGNAQTMYRVRILDESSSIVWDSGDITSGDKSVQVGTPLGSGTYTWRVAVAGSTLLGFYSSWTGWADGGSLLAEPSSTPSASGLSSIQPNYCSSGPAGILSWVFSDEEDGDTQSAYQIQIDGNADFSSPEIDTGKIMSASDSYATGAGVLFYGNIYYWRVKVWDSYDSESEWSDSDSLSTPSHAYPSIDFSWSPQSPSLEEIVQFADQSTVVGGVSSWAWTFQNGSPESSAEQNPQVSFSGEGSKQVTLRVTDNAGYSCQLSRNLLSGLPLPNWKETAPQD